MLIRVDPASDTPLFAQVAASVRSDAATGRIRPGDRLPPARDIAASLGINLHTVLRAYQDLRDEGLIEMRRGRGAVVTDAAAALTELHREIVALTTRAHGLGLAPETLASLVLQTAREGARP